MQCTVESDGGTATRSISVTVPGTGGTIVNTTVFEEQLNAAGEPRRAASASALREVVFTGVRVG